MNKIFIWSASWAEHSQTSYQSTIVYEFFKANGYDLVKDVKDSDYILLNAYPFDNYEEKLVLISLYYYINKYKEKKIIIFWSIPDMIYWIRKLKNIIFISYSEYYIFDEKFKRSVSINDINIWRIRFFIPLKIEDISLGDLLHNNLWKNLKLETNYRLSEYDLLITVDSLINGYYFNDKIEEYPSDYNYLEDDIANYYVETTRWCGFNCSYCAIKRVSWFTKSFPIERILKNIELWIKSGATNIIIIDEDVWSYWIDIWLNFAYLINEINKIKWIFKLKFYYLEPKHLEMYYDKIDQNFWINKLSYARITIQTTSQRILKLMNRNYNIENILKISKKLKEINPSIQLGSIVIYWFPTETYEEFKDYFRLLEYFDCTDFLCYADKKWTKSYKMTKNTIEDIYKKSLIVLKMKEKVWDKIDPVIWSFDERLKILKTCYK